MSTGVKLIVRAVDLRVRHVALRLPFRFGSSTLTACPQLFACADIEVPGHGSAQGFAAEMMVPKWFDKRSDRMPDENIADLASATRDAVRACLNNAPATAFGLHDKHYADLMREGETQRRTDLSSAFGLAVLDRAVLDGLCRATRTSFFDAARTNLFGMRDSANAIDMKGWDWSSWLETLKPLRRIEARHTIGLLDELDAVRCDAGDGLPVTLRAVIERYGHRSFKVKLGGDPKSDLVRLRTVLDALDETVGDYRYTVDGNEQYASLAALDELLAGLRVLKPPLYVEQPLPRELSLSTMLPRDPPAPLLMDEADGTVDAFVRGRSLGWTGVSSKSCKGLYKSLINRARCARWNRDLGRAQYFMSAEDLTCQAGLSVQQDLALAALLGIAHSERNGHHYGRGFGDAPASEQSDFATVHPDLYELVDGAARLRIRHGVIAIDSLFAPGYAHGSLPDWNATQSLTH